MGTLQIQDVFEPYYAGRKGFIDHSERVGNKDRQPRQEREREDAPPELAQDMTRRAA